MPNTKIPYYNKDYTTIKTALLNSAKVLLKDKWTDFSENDFGVTILELFSGVADMLSFNIDNEVAETFMDTARKRENVASHAEFLGHNMQPKISGVTNLSIAITNALDHNYTIPAGTVFKTTGTTPRYYTTKDNFLIPSTVAENRCCVFTAVQTSGSGNITDSALTGISIADNTDGAKLYLKMQSAGGLNKIAVYKNSARTGALDNTATDPDKVAYGEVATGTYVIALTAVNSSGISGNLYYGSADLPTTAYSGEELHISGPQVHEGVLVTETFTSTGEANQEFNTSFPVQKIPGDSNVSQQVAVNSVAWTEVPGKAEMLFSQTDIFYVKTIEKDYSTLVFGDGSSGNIPPDGATITITYINGNGALGHAGAGKITQSETTLLDSTNVLFTQQYNIASTTDAADEETILSAKQNGINFYKNRGRMVHEDDYEALIEAYQESGEKNPKLVQAIKDETEPDLVNELEIYVLSLDPDTGRYTPVTINLTTAGDLWTYIHNNKTVPEGIRKPDGTSGINNGILDASSAAFYYTIHLITGFDREVVREAVREVIKSFYHSLKFQESVDVYLLASAILAVTGVQNIQIFTDSARTTNASTVTISGYSNRGKVLVLPTAFYSSGERVYLKVFGD